MNESLAKRIRKFFEDLFTSRHVRFIEAEMHRVRLEKDRQIEQLRSEKEQLQAKVEKLEVAMWSTSSKAGSAYASQDKPAAKVVTDLPPSKYQQALTMHMKQLDKEEQAVKEN